MRAPGMSMATRGLAEVLPRFSSAHVSTSTVTETPVPSGVPDTQHSQKRFPDQGVIPMATTDTRPAARDRNPGPGRPAAYVDPAVPLPAVLDLVQAAALLGLGRTTDRKSTRLNSSH